ncbi:MAG: transglutaminase [Clostridiaceae bacterium]|nr:transglutaminase [Clostridiaceae bacterium]
MKKFKALVTVLLSVILLSQSVLAYGFSEHERYVLLFPEQFRTVKYFQGVITSDILSRLRMLSPAGALNALNVLRGDGTGNLMLDETAARAEGAVMLVRLLGAEDKALEQSPLHPFTDVPDWAGPYVGYLYQNGLTIGIGNNLYGSSAPIDEKSYLVFLLRALGYRDGNGEDFTWNTVEQAAVDAGLLMLGEVLADGYDFKRSRLAELSWRAMFLNHKKENKSLISLLYDRGMISYSSLEELLTPVYIPVINKWLECLPELEKAFINHSEKIELSIDEAMAKTNWQKYLSHIIERAEISTGVFQRGYSSELWQEDKGYKLYVMPRYINTFEQDRKLFSKLDEITRIVIKPGMTDYEKELAFHDFIVENIEYDTSFDMDNGVPRSSSHALGALETGFAVCEGYAQLMMLLLNRAGIPCRMVTGVADGELHAWNMVLLNGDTYHVDVTWDDPVPVEENAKKESIRYDYFNVNDKELGKSHTWITADYPACVETAENYFVKNKLIVNGIDNLKIALENAVKDGKTESMFKLQNMDPESLDIGKIMIEITGESDYNLEFISCSFDPVTLVIRFEMKYRKPD